MVAFIQYNNNLDYACDDTFICGTEFIPFVSF